MTWFKEREAREGKAVSKKNATHLAKALKHLSAIADEADDDDLAGPDGTEGNAGTNDDAVAEDGTGVSLRMAPAIRISGMPCGPTMRTMTGETLEVR